MLERERLWNIVEQLCGCETREMRYFFLGRLSEFSAPIMDLEIAGLVRGIFSKNWAE